MDCISMKCKVIRRIISTSTIEMLCLKVTSLALLLVLLQVFSSAASRIRQPAQPLEGCDEFHGSVIKALLIFRVIGPYSDAGLAERQFSSCPFGTHACSATTCCPDGFDCVGTEECCPSGETCVGNSGGCAPGGFRCPGGFCCFIGTDCGQETCLEQTTSTSTRTTTRTTIHLTTETPKMTTTPETTHTLPRTTATIMTTTLSNTGPSVKSISTKAASSGRTSSDNPTATSIASVPTTSSPPTNTIPVPLGVATTNSVTLNGGARGHAMTSLAALTYAIFITVAFATNLIGL